MDQGTKKPRQAGLRVQPRSMLWESVQLATAAFLDEVPGLGHDDIGQQQQRDEVGHRHQAVEHVSRRPDQAQIDTGPQQHRHDVDDAIDGHHFLAPQVGGALLAVVAPAQDGGIGEEDQTEGDEPATGPREQVIEGVGGERRPRIATAKIGRASCRERV